LGASLRRQVDNRRRIFFLLRMESQESERREKEASAMQSRVFVPSYGAAAPNH